MHTKFSLSLNMAVGGEVDWIQAGFEDLKKDALPQLMAG